MKKPILIVLSFLIALLLAVPVFAAVPQHLILNDGADLLRPEEESTLLVTMNQIMDQYGVGVFILTADSLDGKTAEAYADDYYDTYLYADYPDGILLLISMEYRDWAMSTSGKCIDALSNSALDSLFEAMSDQLRNNDFYGAFSAYLHALQNRMQRYVDDTTVDGRDYLRVALVALAAGVAVGGIAILVMRGQMKTAVAQHNADSYIVGGSFNMTRRADIYLYSRVSKTRRAENNSSSTHRSSGGHVHGGRSGKF